MNGGSELAILMFQSAAVWKCLAEAAHSGREHRRNGPSRRPAVNSARC
jgi:hypothetical protein